ncbi:ARM repeat-containing protein [Hysterangium stoloniferum]|nr:ARM repeat-containing protein [Hysterangium stoloniferum]
MPRENRKRGKKHKNKPEEPEQQLYIAQDHENPHQDGIEPDVNAASARNALEAPFGLLDPDLKAYFKTVDDQLKDWQDEKVVNVDTEVDANEERRMFFVAALSEMNGKELQLASDPECSPVLERMIYSMDDFVRRVFADSLAGSWLSLITNRFASHVCQTLFALAGDTIGRESRGIFPSTSNAPEKGELLSLTRLVLDACDDVLPELLTLMRDPFGSHVLRTLLILLAPPKNLSSSLGQRHAPAASSKKSTSWKARRGPMKAILPDQFANSTVPKPEIVEFTMLAKKFLDRLRSILDGNEVRALAMDKVASPVLQIFIELEASLKESDRPSSLMDHLLAGLISESDFETDKSSFVSALLVDVASSHISESILSHSSTRTFSRIWKRWIVHDLPQLVTHPVANFVVAKGILRLSKDELTDTITRLESVWKKILKFSRFGVLLNVIERCGQLNSQEDVIIETICSLYEIRTAEDRRLFVPCILRLQTLTVCPLFKNVLSVHGISVARNTTKTKHEFEAPHLQQKNVIDPLGPKTQGSLILQSILRMHEPYIHIVLDSLHSLPAAGLLALACNPTSSRIFDSIFESPTVPIRSRKKIITSFLGQFHLLVDDRIGSRVADRFWDAADPYLKEKIARSLLPHEQFLAGSHFGRFFTKNLGLTLLKRNIDHWKATRSKQYKPVTSANAIPTVPEDVPNTKTLKRKPEEDEIDTLFNAIVKKKVRGVASLDQAHNLADSKSSTADLDLAVLKAIKDAPRDLKASKK